MVSINKNMLESASKHISIDAKKIGLLLGRGNALISAIYNCYNNGFTYIPLDVSWPKERINHVLLDSKTDMVITNSHYKKMLTNVKTFCVNDDDVICFDNYVIDNDNAYIIYTSGSTGIPKGVEVSKKSLLNFIDGISEIIDFSHGKRIACLTTVSLDKFFLESVMALYKGLTIIMANEDEQRNPKLMAKLIKDNDVDMIQMTPSRMQLLLNHDKELSSLKNVKEIMIGGESFPLNLLRSLQQKTTAQIYNMYGQTETTIWSTVSNLTHKDRIDIGNPIKDTEIYIVDDNFSILSNGQAGEICIAGKGLAKGYVGKDDLTTEKFIFLPQKPDVRIYRTGDMGRYLSNGDLECLGRTDNRVKIHGHRIELEEIEAHLNQVKGIKQSVVIALEASETDKILEAFFTSDVALDQKDISSYLSSKLPDYMIPTLFKRVESFIQTANGKIDRNKVLECIEIKSDTAITKSLASDNLNDIQKKALEIITSNTDPESSKEVTLDTDFSIIGIDSITFITVIVALEVEFDFEFDDEKLLFTAFPTVRTMVEYVELKIFEK